MILRGLNKDFGAFFLRNFVVPMFLVILCFLFVAKGYVIQVLALRAFVELNFEASLLHLLDYALGEPSAESPKSFSHVWIHIYSGTSLTIKLAMDKICWA